MASKTNTPSAESASMILSALTLAGLVAWAVSTHYRVGTDQGWLPDPKHWFTSAIPIWIAHILLGIQMVLLISSAITAITQQGMGMKDMLVSGLTFAVTLVIVTLVAAGNLKTGSNMVNGLAAFTWTNGIEAFSTLGVWMIANRRPGGAIGGSNP